MADRPDAWDPRERRIDRGAPDGVEVEVLAGGVGNAGAVVHVGEHVLRPTSPHTPAIHVLLTHLAAVGFDGALRAVGVEADGRERLVFIPGDVAVPPFPAWSQTDAVLASTAALLRRYHDAVAGFVSPPGVTWSTRAGRPDAGRRPDCVPQRPLPRERRRA
ncbi:MAG: hypothetical protein R2690_07600 [Acidimicrobiales bacterium]